MPKFSFQYAKGRFCDPNDIVDASHYSKQATTPDAKGEYPVVIRVALSMDTSNKDKSTLYSDAMPDIAAAEHYIAAIPSN